MSPAHAKVSDEAIVAAYRRLRSCKRVGAELGINGASVHERLVKLGENRGINAFTGDDLSRLERDYVIYRDAGRLDDLAVQMGRTKQFLARKAGEIGLTDRNAPALWKRTWKGMPESTAQVIWEDFKASSLGLGAYCRAKGYDDLGFARTMKLHFGDEWDYVIELKAPKQSMYRLGRAFEYAIRDRLKALGYFVMRSPASRSPIDLVAIAPGAVLFVQCKRGGALIPKEWNQLFDLALSVGARPIMAERVGARDVAYWLLTDRKDGSRRRQPMRPFDPGERVGRAA